MIILIAKILNHTKEKKKKNSACRTAHRTRKLSKSPSMSTQDISTRRHARDTDATFTLEKN